VPFFYLAVSGTNMLADVDLLPVGPG